MAKRLDKAALMAALKTKIVDFPIEGFGTVGIKQLSVVEIDALRESTRPDADEGEKDQKSKASDKNSDGDPDKKKEKKYVFGLRLVIESVVNEDGSTMLDSEDLAALEKSNHALVDKLVGKALAVNGFVKEVGAKN